MKRDAVMALTDEALRIKADELMGGTDELCDGDIDEAAQGYWQCLKCGASGFDWGDTKHKRRRPDYPNDIAAAMGLWDAMLERGLTVEMYSRRDGRYAVVVGFPDAHEMYRYSEDIEENKPSRAITRAFILATQEG